MMKIIITRWVLIITVIASLSYSCSDYLEIDAPKDRIAPAETFANDASATAAITGIYSRMMSTNGFTGNQSSISVTSSLSADDLRSHSTALDVFFKNQIPTSNTVVASNLWTESYAYIYTCNAVLAGLKSADKISEATSKQLQGEAKFVRAFCYFYLTNLFGDVPLNLTSDYKMNASLKRSSKEDVFTQIIADLLDAESLLTPTYVSTERIRPNRAAATSLLSRAYLYTGKWDLAIQKATEVIDQKATYGLSSNLDQVFLKNSTEAIWQMMPTQSMNTPEGSLYVLTATPTFVSLSPSLLPLFDNADTRKAKWIGQFTNATGTYYYPNKYKIKTTSNGLVSEYAMVIRLAELYLIRAEARAKLSQTELALADINTIRSRAGLTTPLNGLNQAQCLAEVEKQRQLELFTEWGHRWFDLKRTARASAVLSPLKGGTWQDTDVLFPIPDIEINRNPNINQNPGY